MYFDYIDFLSKHAHTPPPLFSFDFRKLMDKDEWTSITQSLAHVSTASNDIQKVNLAHRDAQWTLKAADRLLRSYRDTQKKLEADLPRQTAMIDEIAALLRARRKRPLEAKSERKIDKKIKLQDLKPFQDSNFKIATESSSASKVANQGPSKVANQGPSKFVNDGSGKNSQISSKNTVSNIASQGTKNSLHGPSKYAAQISSNNTLLEANAAKSEIQGPDKSTQLSSKTGDGEKSTEMSIKELNSTSAKVGTQVAALVGHTWLLATVLTHSIKSGRYGNIKLIFRYIFIFKIELRDDADGNTFTLPAKQTKAVMNPSTTLFHAKDRVLALYEGTTCFYPARIVSLPGAVMLLLMQGSNSYLVRFDDDGGNPNKLVDASMVLGFVE